MNRVEPGTVFTFSGHGISPRTCDSCSAVVVAMTRMVISKAHTKRIEPSTPVAGRIVEVSARRNRQGWRGWDAQKFAVSHSVTTLQMKTPAQFHRSQTIIHIPRKIVRLTGLFWASYWDTPLPRRGANPRS